MASLLFSTNQYYCSTRTLHLTERYVDTGFTPRWVSWRLSAWYFLPSVSISLILRSNWNVKLIKHRMSSRYLYWQLRNAKYRRAFLKAANAVIHYKGFPSQYIPNHVPIWTPFFKLKSPTNQNPLCEKQFIQRPIKSTTFLISIK